MPEFGLRSAWLCPRWFRKSSSHSCESVAEAEESLSVSTRRLSQLIAGVDWPGSDCRDPDVAIEPSDQQLADLTRAPMRLLGLQPNNQPLDLLRQLVCIAYR